MLQSFLSLDQSPPFSAPSRFFLTAPLWGIFSVWMLLLGGADLIASRWHPALLALTHALAIGMVLQVMLGALLQVLPVLVGANVPRVGEVASVVHFGLNFGAFLLCSGFWFGEPAFILAGAGVLSLTLSIFLWATGRALLPLPLSSPVVLGLKLVWFGLLVTGGLGLLMALGLNGWVALDLLSMVDWHAAWGLGGAVGLLLFVMATVVVPMFQLTPAYRVRYVHAFIGLLCAALMCFVGQYCSVLSDLVLAKALLYGLAMSFAVYTLWLQKKRRRATVDITVRLWQQGLTFLSLWSFVGLCQLGVTDGRWFVPAFDYLWGFVVFVGVLLPLVIGMLYKILPFLAWLHLQSRAQGLHDFSAIGKLPNMNHYLSKRLANLQAYAHWGFVVTGMAYPWFVSQHHTGWGYVLFGATGTLSFVLLECVLVVAVWRYHQSVKTVLGATK